MPAALLDTNAVSDLMRDHVQVKARVGHLGEPVVTSAVTLHRPPSRPSFKSSPPNSPLASGNAPSRSCPPSSVKG
jgi:hypothetical protein